MVTQFRFRQKQPIYMKKSFMGLVVLIVLIAAIYMVFAPEEAVIPTPENITENVSAEEAKTQADILAENEKLKADLEELREDYDNLLSEKEDLVTQVEELEKEEKPSSELAVRIKELEAETANLHDALEYWFVELLADGIRNNIDPDVYYELLDTVKAGNNATMDVVVKVNSESAVRSADRLIRGWDNTMVIAKFEDDQSVRAVLPPRRIIELFDEDYVTEIEKVTIDYEKVTLTGELADKFEGELIAEMETSLYTRDFTVGIVFTDWPSSSQLTGLEDDYGFIILGEYPETKSALVKAENGRIVEAAALDWIKTVSSAE